MAKIEWQLDLCLVVSVLVIVVERLVVGHFQFAFKD